MNTIQTIVEEIRTVCMQVSDEQLRQFMEPIRPNRRIFVDGEGRSGLVIRCFAMRLVHLGYHAYVIGETTTPAMREGDVLIAVSGSGTSQSAAIHMKKAKKAGCTVLLISAKKENPLLADSDVFLLIPGTVKKDEGEARQSVQLLSSLFDQSLHVVVDGIALELSRRDQVDNKEATAHHF